MAGTAANSIRKSKNSSTGSVIQSRSSSSSLPTHFWGLFAILVFHLYQTSLLQQIEYNDCGSTNLAASSTTDANGVVTTTDGAATDSSDNENDEEYYYEYTPKTERPNITCQTKDGENHTFPQIPNFIVIGTQKGGTSALSALLDHHPWIESSYYFEPHFFDFNEYMMEHKHKIDNPKVRCLLLKAYLDRNFNQKRMVKYPNVLAFEKTPAYILTPNAPSRIRAVAPWSKIVVTLRNPVDRLISQHAMTVMRWWENRSFHETLAHDVNVMRHEGFWLPQDDPFNASLLGPPDIKLLRKYKTEGMLYRGFYARQLRPWLEQYTYNKDLFVVRYDELRDNPGKVVTRLARQLGAPYYQFPPEVLTKNYSPKRSTWRTDYKPNVSPEALDFLKRSYKPYNDELVELLGEEWRGVWDDKES